MIYRLRKKFIQICTISFAAVFLGLFSTLYLVNVLQTNRSLDVLADLISDNGGRYPMPVKDSNSKEENPPPPRPVSDNKEAPYTTRYFTVRWDENGNVDSADVRSIASVTEEEAIDMAEKVRASGKMRGWMGDFRYKVYETSKGRAMVFISGSAQKDANRRFLGSACAVFLGGSFVVLFLVILFSKRAVRPTAESYEKQKRFITDASHELKTPLTLIRTDLEIAESEIGKNEWLEDIREASDKMSELVSQLVALARMDEEHTTLEMQVFSLSDAVADSVSAFEALAERKGRKLEANIAPGIDYRGNEASIRQLLSILMDNALKYCDEDGLVTVTLRGDAHPVLTVDNSFRAVGNTELNRLFDRFYRADQARTFGHGFGIGLSIAKAIVEKHHGEITAQNTGDGMIRFRVRL